MNQPPESIGVVQECRKFDWQNEFRHPNRCTPLACVNRLLWAQMEASGAFKTMGM